MNILVIKNLVGCVYYVYRYGFMCDFVFNFVFNSINNLY